MAKASAKKKWFTTLAPSLFNEQHVGDTPGFDSSTLPGKVIKVNLANLTNEMRKQNTEISLMIDKVEGDTAKTKLIGLRIIPTAIRRLVRKGRTRIDESIKVITKDELVMSIKLLIITRFVVQGSVKRALRAEIKRYVLKRVTSASFNETTEQIIRGRFQKELREKLAKTYPVRVCDVRSFKLERFIKSVDVRKIKAEMAKNKKKVVEEPKEEPEEKQ